MTLGPTDPPSGSSRAVAAPAPPRPAAATAERPTFDQVYEDHFDFVCRTLWRLGVPMTHVDDAAQDAFVVVHRRLGEFEARASLKTWLFQIARKVASDFRRQVRRKSSALEPLSDTLADASSATPQASAERSESMAILAELLDQLDEDKRAVLVLAELEQMTAPEMADALGINVNTVYSRLRLAREEFNSAVTRYRRRIGR